MSFVGDQFPDVVVFEPRVHHDSRGYFLESWNERAFRRAGIEATFVQHNHSHSIPGTVRGLHYQLTRPQGKLVRVIRGSVFDVTVDLRRSSPNFGRWTGRNLSDTNHRVLWIPEGFAHGFYVRSEADLVYECTDFYHADDERTLLWNDPALGIEWPITTGEPPVVSERDLAGSRLADAETYP